MNPVDGDAGKLHLRESLPAHVGLVWGSRLVEQQVVQPGQDSVTFIVDVDALVQSSALVSVCVVSAETGQPVAGARVGFEDMVSMNTGAPVDADGRITMRDIPPGRLELSIQSADDVARALMVEVHPGADLDLGNIRVESPVLVGIEIPGVTGNTFLTVFSLDPAPNDLVQPGRQRQLVDGGKRVDLRLFPGRYVLHASNRKAGTTMLEIDTRALPPLPLRLALAPAAPLTFDVEVAGTHIQLVHGEAAVLLERTFAVAIALTLEVHPGDYTVRIRPPNGPSTALKLSVPPDGARLRVP